jgi:Zn-dependent protease
VRSRKWMGHKRLRIFGAPIYIHWSVLVVVCLLALSAIGSPVFAAIAISSYLGIIAIHECGHAFVAKRLGYQVYSIQIAFLHGRCEYAAPRQEWDGIAIAWGGVLAQLLIAIPVLILAGVLGQFEPSYLGPVVVMLGYLNLMIALVNLAPVRGLDGAIAWRIVPLLWTRKRSRSATERAQRKWKR